MLHVIGWCGLAVVTVYFAVAGLALRWRPNGGTRAVRYEPPASVSPAIAAYLFDRGVTDKSLVVAIVNMASKGYLRIEQGPEDYLLSRINAEIPLEAEEDIVAEGIFGRRGDPVRLSEIHRLPKIAIQVRQQLESAVEPDLLSPHFPFFVPGLTISLWCFLGSLHPEIQLMWDAHAPSALLIPVFFAVWSLLATIRTLPALMYKLKSLLPGRSPYRMRFVRRDATLLFLLLTDCAALGLIAWVTSPQFAMLFGGYVLANLVGWVVLRAPTAAGWILIHQLSDFRTFLAAVDSDRVNRVNAPNAPSAKAEKYWAWALAMDIEHAWGEQFAAAVLNRLGPSSAMVSIENNLPEEANRSNEVLDLHLR